jgi:hypothetical protein
MNSRHRSLCYLTHSPKNRANGWGTGRFLSKRPKTWGPGTFLHFSVSNLVGFVRGSDVRAWTPPLQPVWRPALQFRRAAVAWHDHLPLKLGRST